MYGRRRGEGAGHEENARPDEEQAGVGRCGKSWITVAIGGKGLAEPVVEGKG